MRIKGKLKSWNDDRGFGFIDPIQGGEEIFVHIKAFGPGSDRPEVNALLWYEVELGPRGKKRAKNVEFVRRAPSREFVRRAPSRSEKHSQSSAQRGGSTLYAIPAFFVLYVVVSILWHPSLFVAAFYVAASAVTYLAYAGDKAAAQQGAWRTPESNLHVLALIGGWPGALLAQQLLRHKSLKPEFRAIFWCTVVLNVAGFVIFCALQFTTS